MAKKMTQCERVLAFIKDFGKITDNDAHNYLHINRLSGRIFELRSQGYNIVMDWEIGKNIYGDRTRYGVYRLED